MYPLRARNNVHYTGRGLCPQGSVVPHTLHQSRASLLTLQGSQWDSKGDISPNGSPVSSAGGQGKMGPHCHWAELGCYLHKPKSLGDTGCRGCLLVQRQATVGTAGQPALWNTLPMPPSLGSSFPAASPSLLPSLSYGPHSAKWLHIPLAKGEADQPSDPLWKDPPSQPTFPDSSAWCIQKSICIKGCQYSMNKLQKN